MLDDPIMLAKAVTVQADDMLLRAGVVAMLDWLDAELVIAHEDEDYEFDAMEMLEVLVQTTLLGHYHRPSEEEDDEEPEPASPTQPRVVRLSPITPEQAEAWSAMLKGDTKKNEEDDV